MEVLDSRTQVPLPDTPSAATNGTNYMMLESKVQRHPLPQIELQDTNYSQMVTILEPKSPTPQLPRDETDGWCWSKRPRDRPKGNHAILNELNYCRRNPHKYADEVVAPMLRCKFTQENGKIIRHDKGSRIRMKEGEDGKAAIRDCLEFLRQQPEESNLKPLRWSEPLSRAAKDQVLDLGLKGIFIHDGVKHMGTDGSMPVDRIKKYCSPTMTGENIHYGKDTSAEAIVRALVVDDGVPSRGHRLTIFNENLENVGIFVGEHGVRNFRKDKVNRVMPHIGKMLKKQNRNAVNDFLAKKITPLELETIWKLYDWSMKTNEAHEACRNRAYGEHGPLCPFPRMHSIKYGHMCVMDFATFPLHAVTVKKMKGSSFLKELPVKSRTILTKMTDLLENHKDRRKLVRCIFAAACRGDVEVTYTPCTELIRIDSVEGVKAMRVPTGEFGDIHVV